jgi:hypothetical protein
LNQTVNNVQRSIGQQLSNINTSPINGNYTGVSKVIQRGKVNELTGFEATSEIEKRNLALGETLTIYKELKKEQDEEIGRMEETSRQYETNYELQAKAAAKAHEQAIQEEARYRTYVDKENAKAQKEQEALTRQQQQQQAKVQKERERNSSMYTGMFDQITKEEQKAIDYNLKKQSDAEIALANLQSKAFSQNNPLTGNFKTSAENAIAEWKAEIDKIQSYSQKMTQEQENGLKKAQANAQRIVLEQQKAQWQGDKLAAKDVSQKVTNAEWGLDIRIEELKQAGQYSDEAKTKIEALRASLAQVGDQKGFNEWSKQLQQFNQEIKLSQAQTKTGILTDNFNLDVAAVTKQFDELKQKYKEITDSNAQLGKVEIGDRIQRISDSLNNINPQNISTVRKELNALKGDIDAIQVPKDISGEISNYASKIDLRIESLKQVNQYTGDAKAALDGLKESLGRVSDENGLKEWVESYKMIFQELNQMQAESKTNTALKGMEIDAKNLSSQFDNLVKKYREITAANPSKADAGIEGTISRLQDMLNNLDMSKLDPNVLKLFRKELIGLGREINGLQPQTLSQVLTQNLGGVGQYLARFTSAFYIINTGIRTIKSMVNEVKELDTSLMELQKVTNMSGDSLVQFTDDAYKTGKEVGRTGKDVIDAVTTFSRAGYNLEESNELAKAALTMTNVGVDIQSTEAAASDMISILRAYDKQANESMQVIDELYNVANREPLDFGNITDMLVTAGGTLAQTNTSLEETMGLLTGAFATMRDTSVANG